VKQFTAGWQTFRWWRRGWNGGAEVAGATVKRLLCCGFRRNGKAMGQLYQCRWRICRGINVFFSRFEYHMFYVLYPFVSYLLTLPRIMWGTESVVKPLINKTQLNDFGICFRKFRYRTETRGSRCRSKWWHLPVMRTARACMGLSGLSKAGQLGQTDRQHALPACYRYETFRNFCSCVREMEQNSFTGQV
jgi:hypothetical protein